MVKFKSQIGAQRPLFGCGSRRMRPRLHKLKVRTDPADIDWSRLTPYQVDQHLKGTAWNNSCGRCHSCSGYLVPEYAGREWCPNCRSFHDRNVHIRPRCDTVRRRARDGFYSRSE